MNRVIKRLKSVNSVLPRLWLGILLYGLLAELIGVWFVPDKVKYTLGLWIGIGISIYMSFHMAISIRSATDFTTEKQAKAITVFHAVLRYAVVAAVFFLTVYFHIGYILAILLGAMSLKVSAYLQPTLNKILDKRR